MREMKDSGIEWIGRIPKEWGVDKIKYHLKRNEPRNPGNTIVLSVYRDYGVIPKDSRDDNHNVTSEDTSKYKYVQEGNLVINKMKAWQGSLAVSDYTGIVSPAYFIYQFTDKVLEKSFIHFLLRNCYKDEFRRISGGIRESQWDLPAQAFENTSIIVPASGVQAEIVHFLNNRCSEIDSLSADIQKQIDILNQYKRSVITEAVTKGLDKNSEMRDSGVEWIGEVPKEWKIRPLYYFFAEGKNKNSFMKEQNLLSLSYGNVIRKNINTNGGLLPANFSSYNIVEKNDIIIRPTDLQNDKKSLRTGLVKEHGIITSAYIDLRPKYGVNTTYFYYLLHSYDLLKVFYNMGNGVRQGLNFSEFSKLPVVIPSSTEQKHIVDYLDSCCSEIDLSISEKQKQLDKLAEYKKSLIYEYVTGKKEVPNAE